MLNIPNAFSLPKDGNIGFAITVIIGGRRKIRADSPLCGAKTGSGVLKIPSSVAGAINGYVRASVAIVICRYRRVHVKPESQSAKAGGRLLQIPSQVAGNTICHRAVIFSDDGEIETPVAVIVARLRKIATKAELLRGKTAVR